MTTQPTLPMTPAQRELFDAAVAKQQLSYSPYSHFKVGAAIRTKAGNIYAACNIENAAYPQSTCGEASAIAIMVANGEREIAEVLTVCDGDLIGTCCGGCRQRIREFAPLDTPIYACGPDGLRAIFTLDQLLPNSFGPEHLLG